MGVIIVRLPRQTRGKDKEKIKENFHYLGADREIKPYYISVGSLNKPEPGHINQANFKRLHTRESLRQQGKQHRVLQAGQTAEDFNILFINNKGSNFTHTPISLWRAGPRISAPPRPLVSH